jgi:hypothetical protein
LLFIIVTMLMCVILAATIGLYVAYPHRGESVPGASWLGGAMRRGVDSLPTLDEADASGPLGSITDLVRPMAGAGNESQSRD